MKNSWFELLYHFVEKTIAQLNRHPNDQAQMVAVSVEQVNNAQNHSLRVFTYHEQMKLTKASHQFLVRMASWGVISAEILELIINRLIFSDSRIVSLRETKVMVRNTLINHLSYEEIAFLDLIMCQKEDRNSVH
jgi:Smg protein